MAQTANNSTSTTREAALARRRAMSQSGKAALKSSAGGTAKNAGSAPQAAPTRSRSAATGGSASASARAASLARRQAMSTRGKAAVSTQDRTRAETESGATRTNEPVNKPAAEAKAKGDCGCGGNGERKEGGQNRGRGSEVQASEPRRSAKNGSNGRGGKTRVAVQKAAAMSPGRAASLARRQAMSNRGKAGLSANGMTSAQTARAANPNLSARELAQAVREQRSRTGRGGQKKSAPCGRVRPNQAGEQGGAQDAPWKVGTSETSHGQHVTGTMVGRSMSVTGDEPSTCREITGTEYLGADIFRSFCQTDPGKGPRKVRLSPTARGNRVTGNEVGRSRSVTGDEPGTCKRVTGTEYLGAQQVAAFCGTKPEAGASKITGTETRKGKSVTGSNVGRSDKVTGDEPGAGRELTGTQYMQKGTGKYPTKVGSSATLRGGNVTGTMVGRSERVTGDEPGTCRNVTGDDYIGQEQYRGFCETAPAPKDQKVGASRTLKGEPVTGTMTGRSGRVTGDEPGTCKAITGTPYAGAEQYKAYCDPKEGALAAARTRPQRAAAGAAMTGLQPGLGGKTTGDRKGACEPLTGTPYVGADQYAASCPAQPAEPGSPDFPQMLGGTPWGQFSVASPSHASQTPAAHGAVTGTRYEQGQITGPFGKAGGKVTGTEEARFDRVAVSGTGQQPMPVTAETVEGRLKSRVTGEGMDAGIRVTGDDWDRGDRVTGTEGTPATGRNPTRRGAMSAMPTTPPKRNEELPAPNSKVTGGSGNTERGSLVTYSGGARG